MKIIAKKENAEHYLVDVDGDEGFIVDKDNEIRFPQIKILSILARGYWQDVKNIPSVINDLSNYQEVS